MKLHAGQTYTSVGLRSKLTFHSLLHRQHFSYAFISSPAYLCNCRAVLQLYIAVQAVYRAYLGKLLEREVFGVFKAVSTSACAFAPSLVQMIRFATSPTEKFHALGIYLPYGIRFLRGLRFEVTYSGHLIPPYALRRAMMSFTAFSTRSRPPSGLRAPLSIMLI